MKNSPDYTGSPVRHMPARRARRMAPENLAARAGTACLRANNLYTSNSIFEAGRPAPGTGRKNGILPLFCKQASFARFFSAAADRPFSAIRPAAVAANVLRAASASR